MWQTPPMQPIVMTTSTSSAMMTNGFECEPSSTYAGGGGGPWCAPQMM